ncbi:hypothetical protein [Yokenella regensburgei]|uniref:hypothetical protein n=1 Tax=Yokenella regensburgei TaxID=158877 RepID=UPI001432A070|nr:hypothetical protein [Yokenella regensburgei]QIU89316.1 hypothetical protein HEC60_08240 [Yokenella regensburgei]
MKTIFLALGAIMLVGCSTQAVTTQNAHPVPTERILYSGNGTSTITVTRDNGWFAGGGCFVELTVDGKPYARIDTGETVSMKVEAGRHILGISGDSQGKGLCGFKVGQPLKETSTELNANETQKFRITGDTNSGLDIRPTSI